LAVGFSVALFSTIIGTIVGVIAGHYGGWIDNVVMRITDLFLAVRCSCSSSSEPSCRHASPG